MSSYTSIVIIITTYCLLLELVNETNAFVPPLLFPSSSPSSSSLVRRIGGGGSVPQQSVIINNNYKNSNAMVDRFIISAAATRSSDSDVVVDDTTKEETEDVKNAEEAKPKSTSKSLFDSFDYNSHWYPVICSQDVPFNQPIRVTLFDIDYVLAKTTTTATTTHSSNKKKNDDDAPQEEITYIAMIDSCPHKKVALSEGRITNCDASPTTQKQKFIQCSYHGWTFDGTNGKCVEIPQTMIAKQQQQKNDDDNIIKSSSKRRREDGIAVAVMEVQGIVWIQPNYTPLEALAALSQGTIEEPPRIPEIDLPGYKTTFAVRDFPNIDWTVLMENIMDPDHGYFAHSSSGAAKGFDWYSADGKDNTVEVYEDFTINEGKGWKITSTVNAVEKLIKYNREVRIGDDDDHDHAKTKSKNKKQKETPPPKMATTTYVAPSTIALCRRTPTITSPSSFVTAFWVCPTGTGKSRFMSAAVSKAPFSIPRWLVHINLNNFLDQDTFLLCGQHRAVLKREAESYLLDDDGGPDGDKKDGGGDDDTTTKNNNHARKSTYVYRSPSERMPVRIGQFFDATLAKVPNRKEALLAWYNKNNSNNKLFESWPTREVVLDRYEQHTKICPNSMDVVKRCDKIIQRSKLLGFVLIFMKFLKSSDIAAATGGSSLVQQTVAVSAAGGFLSKMILNPIRQLFSRSISFIHKVIVECILQGKTFYLFLGLVFLTNYIASRIKREFYFKFDEDLHRKDIKYIAKNWIDL